MVLPHIMLAPNGAHKTKADHSELPITIAEIVNCAISGRNAGADGLHAHVRDGNGAHVLDAGLYQELSAECRLKLPGFYVQITTEAVGRYSPVEQDKLVRALKPKAVSVALRELVGRDEALHAREFYHWASDNGIEVQHILYSADELIWLRKCVKEGVVPGGPLQVLFVLGRYADNQQSTPADLQPFMGQLKSGANGSEDIDWAVCAFGKGETQCLVNAVKLGGKIRVGFENNLLNRDGEIATDNCERVREIVKLMGTVYN